MPSDLRRLNGTTLVVDFDGVIADFVGQLAVLSDFRFHPSMIDRYDHPQLTRALLEKGLHDPATYKYLYPVSNAVQAVRGLYDGGYKIDIATNRNPKTREYVENWLTVWGVPFDSLRLLGFDGNKGQMLGDVLLDDKPVNCQQFVATGRPALLFNQPWNSREPARGYERVRGWDATVQRIRQLKNEGRL